MKHFILGTALSLVLAIPAFADDYTIMAPAAPGTYLTVVSSLGLDRTRALAQAFADQTGIIVQLEELPAEPLSLRLQFLSTQPADIWLGGTADPQLDQSGRWYVAMRLFYPTFAEMPQACWPQATDFLAQFLAAGRREQARPGPPLMDWQQDAPLIAAGISRAASRSACTRLRRRTARCIRRCRGRCAAGTAAARQIIPTSASK